MQGLKQFTLDQAFADIFVNCIIKKTTEFSIQLLMFYRYVDNSFAVFPNRHSDLKFYRDRKAIHVDCQIHTPTEHKNI